MTTDDMDDDSDPSDWPDTVRIANCATCNRAVARRSDIAACRDAGARTMPARLGGRIHSRPYCEICLNTANHGDRRGTPPRNWQTDDDPGQQNAVRDMEEGGTT